MTRSTASAIGQPLHQRQQLSDPLPVKKQTARDQHRMWNRCVASRTNVDLPAPAFHMHLPHPNHLGRIEDRRQRLLRYPANWRPVQHVALAARIHIAVVLHVHRTAPQVVTRMLPIGRRVAALGLHQVRLVVLHTHLIDSGHGLPEPRELVRFVPVPLHPNHLNDNLYLGAALALHPAEVDEVVAHALELCALPVVFERFLGRSVKAQRDVGKRAVKDLRGRLGVEQRSIRRQQRRDVVLAAKIDAVVNLRIEKRCLRSLPAAADFSKASQPFIIHDHAKT